MAEETERDLRDQINKLETIILGLTERSQSGKPSGWALYEQWVRNKFALDPMPLYGAQGLRIYSPSEHPPRITGPVLGPQLPLQFLYDPASAASYGLLGDPASDRLNELRLDFAEQQLALSEAPALQSVPMHRMIQVSIFTNRDTPDDILALWEAMEAIFDAIDCIVYAKARAERGSWLERWLGKTKDIVTSEAVAERLAKLERAAELKGIDNPQADANLKTAKAINVLLKALANTNDSVVLAGSICVVKRNGKIVSSNLTQEQLAEVRRNPIWLKSPEVIGRFVEANSETDKAENQPRTISRSITPRKKPKNDK